MTPQTAKLLLDAFQAASHVRSFSVGRTSDEYMVDVFLRSALERQLAIIGEALNNARALDTGLKASIRNLDEWIGIRRRITHAYDRLDHVIVWDTIVDDVPNLLHDLAQALNQAPPLAPDTESHH